jgi:hypothetical protein
MTEQGRSSDKAAREAEKARRLAEALRANLARRKTRARSIAAGETDSPANDAPEATARAPGGSGNDD